MWILLGLFFVGQIIILKKDFSLFKLLQLAASLVYGSLVDLTTYILSYLPHDSLWLKVIYCALGVITLALGVFTMVRINFILLPQDAIVYVISKKYNKEYGRIKIGLDSMLTAIAIVGSWLLYKRLVHLGIGTIISALLVGKIISKLKELKGLNDFIGRVIGEGQTV